MPPMLSRPHEKRIFCRPSGYQNCGTRSANLVWFFSQTGKYHFETPYSSYAAPLLWDRQFADRIFRSRSIEWHATAKPTQRPHILVAWRNFCCAALPHFVAMCCAALCERTFMLMENAPEENSTSVCDREILTLVLHLSHSTRLFQQN